ncbi:MAG: diguanylate cyclase [Gammaproteobacteria bacterium]|nr:diguanylate cyclase [Gammaproteobacteria bacterium]MDH5801554.1 diguanylate cyclase [Gammaproteobacteria bacterium]
MESDWKQKYLDSLDQLEQKEKHWESIETLLCLGINRVALAAEGVDSALDKQLEHLRKTIRSGKNYSGLEDIVESISKTLKRLDTQKDEHSNHPMAAWERLLDKLQIPKSQSKALKQLRKNLNKANPEDTDSIVQNVATLINTLLPATPETETSAGFFDRFRNKDAADKEPSAQREPSANKEPSAQREPSANKEPSAQREPSANKEPSASTDPLPSASATPNGTFAQPRNETAVISQFGLKLIEYLDFPEEINEKVLQLRDRLSNNAIGGKHEVLSALANLLTVARLHLEREKSDLQSFLHSLNENLQDIYANISGAETAQQTSAGNNKKFGVSMQNHMQAMEHSVQTASELESLKSGIQTQLHAIRKNLHVHMEEESRTQQALARALKQTTAQLRNMEQETQLLKERLYQEHQQAIQDPLTGLHNRLAYEEHIDQEYHRWNRYRQPLVIMVVDIDFFKKINDTYGHRAGDKALRLIAGNLQSKLRQTDFLARYGGEEFVVLMPQTHLEAALIAANKLRTAVQSCEFHYQSQRVQITISCGLTEFEGDDTIETAFQRADKALYQAKQNGRNRCEAIAR